MPSALFARATSMLTDTGWQFPRSEATLYFVYGVDGAGAVSKREVLVSQATEKERSVCIGTRSGIAELPGKTEVVLASGNRIRAEELLDNPKAAETTEFERIDPPATVIPEDAVLADGIIQYLKARSIVLERDKYLIRIHPTTKSDRAMFGNSGIEFVGNDFAYVSTEKLLDWIRKQSAKRVWVLVSKILSLSCEEVELPLQSHGLALNIRDLVPTSARRGFVYQTRQFSSTVSLVDEGEEKSYLQALALCQAVGRSDQVTLSIVWEDFRWRPIGGGFIVAGR